jgi:hypothetical protein
VGVLDRAFAIAGNPQAHARGYTETGVDKAAKDSRAVSPGNDHFSFSSGVLEMMWRWRYFIGAVMVAGYLLISHGAPPAAVAVGAAGAALLAWRRGRASRLS